MTDKKRRAGMGAPPMMSIRDFLRGGYQTIEEPTILLYHSAVLGTFVPGTIDHEYEWTPSPLRTPRVRIQPAALLLADAVGPSAPVAAPTTRPREAYRALRQARRPIEPSTELPPWLRPAGERSDQGE